MSGLVTILKTIFINMLSKFVLAILLIIKISSVNLLAQYHPADDSIKENPSDLYNLTARPWSPLNTLSEEYLDTIEKLCRFMVQHQNEKGAIIDPFLHREHQYSTPYYAFAVGTLLYAGRSEDLLESGVQAMSHASRTVSKGDLAIPDRHGEFYLAPMAEALKLYEGRVPIETLYLWKDQLSIPILDIIENIGYKTNNWRTYGMKGAWARYMAGITSREEALNFIDDGWTNRSQRERISENSKSLYEDWSSDPQSHAVEAVGRGNLVALVAGGYDGEYSEEVWQLVKNGTKTSLLMQDPTGQAPPNGRTDNHIFNDVLYQLIFEIMAEHAFDQGNEKRAGQYRRAALMGFQSIHRWQREDEEWEGAFSITKNHFDPAKRVGYQPASQIGNYTGATMFHLAEAYLTRNSDIPEAPTPAEIGGYVLTNDYSFGSVFANAGGMQVMLNLRGDVVPKYNTFWAPLGALRFSRVGWDSRLGPSDGIHDFDSKQGVTFGPVWKPTGRSEWLRLSEMAEHYRGIIRTEFVHPLLVKFTVLYASVTGAGGPNFTQEFTITPDGVFTSLYSSSGAVLEKGNLGLTLPLLENDGRPLNVALDKDEAIASVSYPDDLGNGDEQNFIVISRNPTFTKGESVRSTYGWLQPVRVTTEENTIHTLVYPRNAEEPHATSVSESFQLTSSGFTSNLGHVDGTIYVGRTSAGGVGQGVDLNHDGNNEVTFEKTCGFIVQLDGTNITAVETDRDVIGHIQGKEISFQAYMPVVP